MMKDIVAVIFLILAETIEVYYLGYRTPLAKAHFYKQERSLM